VRALNEVGTTVFVTTQYLEEADQLADNVGIIDSGRIVAEGTPGSLILPLGANWPGIDGPWSSALLHCEK
jgi:ABC-2 type transport system ATP-binding protein